MGSDGETSHQPGRGLRKVFPPEGATDNTTVDIIAIHGLDTESPGTWTYKGKGRGSSVNWLEDRYMLPAAAPEARVYTYDWNAKVFNNAPVQTLLGHADSLLTLVSCEHGTSGRPILFIASCFGGLILAETICRAAQAGSNYRHILGSTIGIVFLATPFSGTGAANAASWLVVVKGIMGKDASGELIKDLVQRHEFVSERVQKFAEIANADLTRFPIRCFYETGKTKIAKKIFRWGIPDRFLRGSILVTQSSACLDGFDRRGLEKPHVMMNKFQGNDCPDFKQVKEAIQFILKEGPNTLRRRAGKEITRRSVESVMQKKQAQVLESLYFQSMNKRKNDSPDSYPETFQWIFRTDDAEDKSNDLANKRWNDFEAWLESDDAIYWISGKPGSGKTTLMKYLMGNDLTKKALAIWTERTKGVERPVIFSHLFWKAGTEELQRNIKGCLSSILYQAIELDTASLDSILTIHESLLAKKSIHDWSSKELEDVCFAMLRDYPSPACIFLDGLDEICQEDRSSLMELVENLRRLPNTKLCVASRPERDLESAFSKYPHLKLQDLTYSDMEIYASGKIEPYVSKGQITRDFGSDIIDTLVYKAKGVFLWLHLASDSLVRGLKNHDSEETLRERLEEFPDDLNKLYEDIWNRVNKNTKAYRKTAARYLNATITAQKMEKLYVYDRFSLLDLVTATNDQLQRTFRARYTIDEASLIQECKKTLGEIRTQCIGLLEIDMRMMKDNDDGPFQPYVNMSVGFAHRTAYDFLTDTEGGRAILAYDSSPHHELPFKLIKGCLITARLGLSRYHSPVHIIDELSMLPSTIPPPEIEKSLIDTWHLYDDGYFDLKYSRPHFLAIAARSRFADFIKSNIKKSKNPSSLASYVLHYVCTYSRWKVSDYLDNLNSFGEFLLHLGADPNTQAIYQAPRLLRLSSCVPFCSSIACIIIALLTVEWEATDINALYGYLQKAIKLIPNLQEHIPVTVVFQDSYLYINDTGAWDPRDFMPSHVILDLDLASFIETYSKRVLKGGLQMSEDEILHRSPGKPSNSATSCIALIKNPAYRGNDPKYLCCPESETKRLLGLLMQFLHGDKFKDLAQEARQELDKIGEGTLCGSIQCGEIHNLEEYLAERKIGWRFLDKNGAIIE